MTDDPVLRAIVATLPERVRHIYLAYAHDRNAQVVVQSNCLNCGRTFEHAGKARLPMFCSVCRAAPAHGGTGDRGRSLMWDRVGVPPEYVNARLDNFERYGTVADQANLQAVLRAARAWLAAYPNVEPFVVLVGPPGTGKTRLAWALLRELVCTKGQRVRLQTVADFVRELRGTWRRDSSEPESEVLERLVVADTLVLDELSAHALPTDATRDLYPVLDRRLQQGRPTLLLTNETLDSLAGVLNAALLDRVVGNGSVWTFPSSSYRLQHREEQIDDEGVAYGPND